MRMHDAATNGGGGGTADSRGACARPIRQRFRCALVGACLLLCGCERAHVSGQSIDAVRTFGSLGDTPGKFAYPRAIDGSRDGQSVWVIDKTARVQRIDTTTGRCAAMWRMPDSDLGKPVGFCVAPGRDAEGKWCDELLYIADTHYARVMVYKPPSEGALVSESGKQEPGSESRDTTNEPTLVGEFGEYGQGDGQFIYPTDVAVLISADGLRVERIYVGEYGGHDRISVFDGDYRFKFSFGEWGDGHNANKVQFARPQGLSIETIDGQKQLVVSDSCNHRLGRFTLDGQLIGWIGSPATVGEAPGAFKFPYGLASLGDGTVMVSEFGGNRLQRIDLVSGQSMGIWGRTGRGEGELIAPWAVAVMGKETFVVDSGNNRVIGFATPRRR